ncbi:SAM-dependent methyltransferase [Paenibacillus sp. LHD-117]|uniref:class I SAM-dependent methyltransferase n=1 Tax=Paenibacillus sp. LHD-117 TaxID=3071412 RepID=UPI0027E18BD1|nr:SAM-dependent methyltransferase [Paenibacillus sp. LHD-117]MDQ6418984.1 SAM-dependent methyltransferase [Paenibacillus sp. LHD-117]
MRTNIGPASDAVTRLIAVSSLIGKELSGEGDVPCITFADYMAICLYDPAGGYYRAGEARVGKAGDFYTSSGIGDIMARAIAYAAASCHEKLGILDEPLLLAEWGAGTGRLSAQLGAVIEEQAVIGERRYRQLLIEDHTGHRGVIPETFAKLSAVPLPIIFTSSEAWSRSSEWLGGPLMLIANELLDAFPVHRVTNRGGELLELGVAGSPHEGFRYVHMPIADPRIRTAMDHGAQKLEEGQITEINLAANDWIKRIGESMRRGRVLLIDYGHDGEELSASHRMAGTLMTYRHHQANDSPFVRPGEQDITAHVNFTAIRHAVVEAGFRVVYFGTQKQFLVDHGALELLRDHGGADPFSPIARRNRAIRQLMISDGMSESFKVMILEKDAEESPD